MSDTWRRLPTDDRNKVIELTTAEVLELKLLKDHLAARLLAVKSKSYARNELGVMEAVPADEARDLERWIATIHRVLLKVVRS